MTLTKTTIRYLAGPAIAVALAVSGPAVANAEQVWDIGLYDQCMKVAATRDERDRCCIGSGGDIGPVSPSGEITCVAPPAVQEFNPTMPGPFQPATDGVSDDPRAGTPKPAAPVTPPSGVG